VGIVEELVKIWPNEVCDRAEDPVGMRGFNREIISIPNRLASQSSPFYQLRQLESTKGGQRKPGPITC